MNRNDCDIARDLMPLSVDGVCSDGSQCFLDVHVAQCQPCQEYFAGMKNGMLNIKMEPTQEAKSLKRGLHHMSKRIKGLWIALIALACVTVLVLTATYAHSAWWNKTDWAPLDTYAVSIYSNDALVSMSLSGSFYEQVYNGFQQDRYYFALEGDDEEQVILTYLVSWFPNQHKKIASAADEVSTSGLSPYQAQGVRADVIYDGVKLNTQWNSDYRFTTMLEAEMLCVDNGQLCLLDGWDSVETTTGRTMLVAEPGTPVYEIRLSDGEEIRTIYASWKGDVIPNYTADMLDEHGLPQSGILAPSDLDKYSDLIVK